MKAEYTDEGCEAAGWGPFPNDSSDFAGAWTVGPYFKGARHSIAVSGIVVRPRAFVAVTRGRRRRDRLAPFKDPHVPCRASRLLYVPLVPSPRRDRRLNSSRLCPLVLPWRDPPTWLTSRPPPALCLIVVATIVVLRTSARRRRGHFSR